MLAAVQPPQGNGGNLDMAGIATADHHVPRTRVDSGHVVDGDGIIRRLPKLAVRNRTSDESNDNNQAVATNSDTASDNEHSAPVSSNSSQRVRTPMSARSLSDESVNQRRRAESPRQSGGSSKLANATGQTAAKKRRGGMLNFLTLKEPSLSALEEFAEAEKAKTKQRGANRLSIGAHPVSSQKLPDFVPKVNSKWDGLPDSARPKSKDSKAASRAKRTSIMSNATRDTTWTATTTGSSDSKWTNKPFALLPDTPTRDSVLSRGSGKQPPALALDFDPEPVETTSENLPQTFLRGPTPPPQTKYIITNPTASQSPPELEANDVYDFQELAASAPNSPTTPPDGSEARPVLAGIHYPELDSQQKEAELYGNPKTEAVIRANSSRRPVNFCRPRLNLNKPTSPPPITTAPQEAEQERSTYPPSVWDRGSVILSPTLKTPTGNIEPFLTDTFASHSRETGHIPQRVASTLQKQPQYSGHREDSQQPDEDEDGDEDEVVEETPISPISPLEQEWQPARIPEVTMRPPTATSTAEDEEAGVEYQDRQAIESGSQLSLVNSLAPSELSEEWRMSPKERLGLGSKIRKSDAFPWEADDEDLDDAGKGRLSPSVGLGGKEKRLSWFSARKEK